MIYFSDNTINETNGDYKTVLALIRQESNVNDWMLKSEATVVAVGLMDEPSAVTNFILHFWSNGDVCIMRSDHHLNASADADVRELQNWCLNNGWKKLRIDDNLVEDPQGFDFWMRMYISGLIDSDVLRKHEQDDIARLTTMLGEETKNAD